MQIVDENYDRECPFLELRLKSDEEGQRLMQRSTLGRSLFELMAKGHNMTELCENLQKLPETQRSLPASASFRLQVDGFNKKLPQSTKVEKIERLLGTCLKFNGQVDLKKPDHSFHLLEYYGHEGTPPPEQPLFLYFGRWVANGQRERIRQYHLQNRHFIGNTSMDAELSLIMANMGCVRKNDLVLDPFVGTGSLLVACAHYGAYVMGTEIDYLLLHAKARPSRHNQTQRQKSESVQANLRQYGLESQYLDVLVADASRPEIWRQQPLFDAIITDPPYGIREQTRKIGSEQPPAAIPESCLKNHHPQRIRYHLSDIFRDLLDFAARYLRLNGRLVYWLPVFRPEYLDGNIPQHPCLKIIANCEQPLNTTISRRLITMEKIMECEEHLAQSAATVDVDHYEDMSFRQRYFRPNRTILKEQQTLQHS
ncbi:hypothetical protein C0Q70_07961 [Pomacea canaliculata]|uniref:tRNA (guanine(10)-N(2))-methyltransferase TRMT11 n=2 Tax=Pomacea canaliculata TaxID=400727 RepID=A0A2T7PGI1_POMCA|nr:hypothetical protein C0Q70_07961 [Pomacea canaliculata]